MIKNDYLSLKLKELSEIIPEVTDLIESYKFEERRLIIENAFKKLLGLNAEIAESLSFKDLINLIGAYEAADSIKSVILAELLKLDGDLCSKNNNLTKAFSLYTKALNLYVNGLLLDSSDFLEQCGPKIDDILKKTSSYQLSFHSRYFIFRYMELSGKYDKAEDMLYDELEAEDANINMLQEGINFYNRLIKKSDAELINGNLPKDEVEDGLERLNRRLKNS